MIPQIDFVTSTFRALCHPQKPISLEAKFSEIHRVRHLPSTMRLGFSWMGTFKEGDPDFFSKAKNEIKQIEAPFVLFTLGKKSFKWIRLTNAIVQGRHKDRIWCKWAGATGGFLGKGCQSILIAKQALGWGAMGFAFDAIIAAAASFTSFIDCFYIGAKWIQAPRSYSDLNKAHYLFLRLVQGVMTLACTLFTLIGLFFAVLQPITPAACMLLGTACFIASVAKFFFKKESIERSLYIQYDTLFAYDSRTYSTLS